MALNLDPPCAGNPSICQILRLIFRHGFTGYIRSRAGVDFEKFGYQPISKSGLRPTESGQKHTSAKRLKKAKPM